MAKQHFLKFLFTPTEADNERIAATDVPRTTGCFISSVVTTILVGKAAITDFVFFHHNSADI